MTSNERSRRLCDAVRWAAQRGWVCVRTFASGSGHEAHDRHAKSAERPTLDQCLSWAAGTDPESPPDGGNVEVLLHESGLIQVDVEHDAPPEWLDPGRHATLVTRSPSGGLHAVYLRPPGVPTRRWVRAGPKVDLLAKGSWPLPGCRRDDGEWSEVALVEPTLAPDWVLALVPPPPPPRQAAPRPTTNAAPDAWARRAFEDELADVAAAQDGTRRDTLNRAAFNLGQIVGGGALDRSEVVESLVSAAVGTGLDEREARKTAERGVDDGAKRPRTPPKREPPTVRAPPPPLADVPDHYPPDEGVDGPPEPGVDEGVLVPGSWVTDTGVYVEVGCDAFASRTLARVPGGAVYRRAGVAGELVGAAGERSFRGLDPGRARLLVDRHVRLVKWVKPKNEPPREQYIASTNDLAQLVIAKAADHPSVRDLEWLSSYPFFAHDWSIAEPGWHAGAYYDPPPGLHVVPELDPARCRATLERLVEDFPFDSAASRENFFGLLLTPLIRPAIQGNVPLHLLSSSIERTGKTKLAELVFGGVVVGQTTPALQLTGSQDEQDKRVVAALLRGQTVAHLDNVAGDFLDSPVLASLVTSSRYQGRRLGVSEIVDCPNRLTIVASGNNLRATGEIAKRCVPIILHSEHESPEERSDIRHVDLWGYVQSVRREVLGALVGAVLLWRDAGRPETGARLGGFEAWTSAVGGILATIGCDAWLGNRRAWVGLADDFGADLARLVAEWWRCHGAQPVAAKDLLISAQAIGVFGDALSRSTSERGVLTAFGMRVLRRAADRVVGGFRIRRCGGGSQSAYQLTQQTGPSWDLFEKVPDVNDDETTR